MRVGGMKRTINSSNFPLITIVTASFNSKVQLEKTIKSVVSQNYRYIEYIIIDGNSNDGSIELLENYNEFIDFWKSEPDYGVYFAMNKAINLSSGLYTLFLNCGDTFYDEFVITDFINFINTEGQSDIIYGDVALSRPFGLVLEKPKKLQMIVKEMIFSHQACFVKTLILKENLFSTKYKFVSDYFQLYSLYQKGFTFKYFNRCISIFLTEEGISHENEFKCFKELFKLPMHKNDKIWQVKFLIVIIRWKLSKALKFILPYKIQKAYYFNKYKENILSSF